MEKYSLVSTKIISQNPYWSYKLDKYVLPDLSEGDYHYVETPGSVMVIPKTNDDKFIMVKQFRYLNQKVSIEFPGGGIKPQIGELQSAINELSEEAGISSNSITKVGEFNPFNGVTNEICNVYLAQELQFHHANPDNSEEFDIVRLDAEQINELIKTNEIWDGMTLASWSFYYLNILWSKQNDI